VIELAHRQSPWTLDWVRGSDRTKAGFIPGFFGRTGEVAAVGMTIS